MKNVILVCFFASLASAQFPDTLLGTVSVGNNPLDVCMSPDGTRAYAAVEFGFATAIDINGYADFSMAGLVSINGEPVTLECDPSGDFLYVADRENNLVHVINTGELAIEKTLSIQPDPCDMILHKDGNRIYLAHENGMITVINTENQTIENTFWAGEEINSICITPSDELVFAADDGSPQETVINTATGIPSYVTSGMDSYGSAVSGDDTRLFLSCPGWNLVGVMDIASLSMETTISCADAVPERMAALPVLPYLYGISSNPNKLTVIGTDDLTVKGEIALPGGPVNLAVHPDGERIFVVCNGSNNIKVIGFDPSGISPIIPGSTLHVCNSPSANPSVEFICTAGGPVLLKAFDLSGRTVQETQTAMQPGETRQFTFENLPAGILTVTAEYAGTTVTARIIVLEP